MPKIVNTDNSIKKRKRQDIRIKTHGIQPVEYYYLDKSPFIKIDKTLPPPPDIILTKEEQAANWAPTVKIINEWQPDLEETKQKIYANKDVFKQKMKKDDLLRGTCVRLKDQSTH